MLGRQAALGMFPSPNAFPLGLQEPGPAAKDPAIPYKLSLLKTAIITPSAPMRLSLCI